MRASFILVLICDAVFGVSGISKFELVNNVFWKRTSKVRVILTLTLCSELSLSAG